MSTSAGIGRTPYIGLVHARVCECSQPPKELFTARDRDRAIKAIEGYWNVYLTFYGDQLVWLHFSVSDMRDGRVIWRNGAVLDKEIENGKHKGEGRDRPEPGDRSTARWIISGRRVGERPGPLASGDDWPAGH